MVVALVDTHIIIDLLRAYPVALNWYSQQTDLGASRIVWLEVIEGAQNLQKQRQALRLLNHFHLAEVITDDVVLATQNLLKFRLSHQIDVFDCLIAAVSYRLQLPLLSRNLKHFQPLLGALVIKPY